MHAIERMEMRYHWLWVAALILFAANSAFGETVHLTSGESIKGRIIRVDENSVAIESDQGFGVIEIQRSEITLIEFEEAKRDPDRTMGFGYFHRVTPNSVGGQAMEYAVDAFSVKFWLNSIDSLDFLVGFFSADQSGSKLYEVFSFDIRYATVFQRQASLDLYYGGSLGVINVTDNTGVNSIEESGTNMRAFLGAELFFATLPNLGISGEVGVGSQSLGDREVTNISTTTFPTFSMRYYF